MAKDKRTKIDSEDIDGKKKTVYVRTPNAAINKQAQLIYNRAFRDALQSGAILRQKLDDILREQDVWNDEKQEQYDEIVTRLNENEKSLNSGGIKLSEAVELAKEMRQKRDEFRLLVSERTVIDANTAEGKADNARFNCLIQSCLVDESGTTIFSTVEEYENSAAHPFAVEGARLLAEQLYGLDKDYDKTLPENEFLSQYKFVNEDLKFINKEGALIDEEGRLVNEDGRFIDYDEDGEIYFVDIDGNRLTEDGKYDIDFSPFLDDQGKPVPIPEEKTEEESAEAEAEDEVDEEPEVKAEEEVEKSPGTRKPGRPKKQAVDKTE